MPSQILFTCLTMLVSVTVFAYVLGEISNLVMNKDAELMAARSHVSIQPSKKNLTQQDPRNRQQLPQNLVIHLLIHSDTKPPTGLHSYLTKSNCFV